MAMLLAFALAASAPTYGTIGTGADYLKLCAGAALARGEEGKGLRLTCLSFVNGFVRGAAYGESMKPSPGYCLPRTADTSGVMNAIETHLRADSRSAAEPIEQVIWATLRETYRCG